MRRTPHAVLAVALAAACSPPKTRPPMPPGFLFGAAIAGFQAEMGCPTVPAAECEDRRSDWYQWITQTPADVKGWSSGDPPGAGPGHYQLFEHDFDLAANELHLNSVRLSLEWSRIFPVATDGADGDALKALADPTALAHYHAVFAAMKARGLTPLVTLNHYSLPIWLHDGVACHADLSTCANKGWLDKDRAVREIAKYAGFCAREFGAEVDLWATENEPLAIVLPGYVFPSGERVNPPGLSFHYDDAKAVMLALIEAHARMYDAIHANDPTAQVGLVYAMAPARPKDPSNNLDVRAAKHFFYLYDSVFLNGVIKGDVDAALDGKTVVHRDDLAGRIDWLGINYYTRVTIAGTETASFPTFSPLSDFDPLTIQLWEDYPRGAYEMAMVGKDYGLPVYITENGTPDPNDDGTAPSYLVRHLTWVKRAFRDGADVRGYFYWTLFDNYEWNKGMNVRMGLYAVDKTDAAKSRVARQAVSTYAEITQAKDVPADLAEKYPAPE